MKNGKSFDDRLREAVASGSSATVAALIREAEATRTEAAAAAEEARARSLDPLLPATDVDAARTAAADAEFRAQRMTLAAALLHEKRREFAEVEDHADRERIYAAAKAQRDEAAARLAAEYPDLANRLGDLLAAVAAAEAEVVAANARLPAGVARLEGVEATARPGYEPHRANAPALVRISLPAFDAAASEPTWGMGLQMGGERAYRPNALRLVGGDRNQGVAA